MFSRKKKKKNDRQYFSEEYKLLNERLKDIFWKAFFISGFLATYMIAELDTEGHANIFTISLVIIATGFLVFKAPIWLYPTLKPYYDIFKGDYTKAGVSLEQARFTYNTMIFIPAAIISYLLANVINLFVFNKNKITDFLLIIGFNAIALYWSYRKTLKKFANEEGK